MPLEHGLLLFLLSDERNVSQGEPGSQLRRGREINVALPNVIVRYSATAGVTDVVVESVRVKSEHLEITSFLCSCQLFPILTWQLFHICKHQMVFFLAEAFYPASLR